MKVKMEEREGKKEENAAILDLDFLGESEAGEKEKYEEPTSSLGSYQQTSSTNNFRPEFVS